ncbi:DUF190 domain-containing protein [Asticcacaulis sp. EMRT-3]|uniref:DUF190 domain-containing protein n=1 Tax=Asticcacaulis sp. EMRT-3 TaxID=3040349 RepID=UPI0024AF9FE6|nr:DUF190 domain-containing protein [Asticcacaulis sp. EMRT-3]MDI7776382.1 DUF190 domain-containing protein [Asticcacaulis sp. EMRT-3]
MSDTSSSGLSGPASRMRVFIGERDSIEGKPVFEWIVLQARDHGIAGATVLRSPMGYGHSSHVHNATILRLSTDLPMVVELIDVEDRILAFAEVLKSTLKSGLITLESITVIPLGHTGT